MSNIFVLTVGALFLIVVETVLFSSGLFSLAAILAIIVYNKIEWWKFVILFLPLSLVVDSFNGWYIGTYFTSLVVIVVAHSLLKRVGPYHKAPIRILVLFLSFILFHAVKIVLIQLQLNSLEHINLSNLLIPSILQSIFETIFLIVVTYIGEGFFGKGPKSVKLK